MKNYFGRLELGDCFQAYGNTYMRIQNSEYCGDEYNCVCLEPHDDTEFGELHHYGDDVIVDTVMFHPNFERIDDEI